MHRILRPSYVSTLSLLVLLAPALSSAQPAASEAPSGATPPSPNNTAAARARGDSVQRGDAVYYTGPRSLGHRGFGDYQALSQTSMPFSRLEFAADLGWLNPNISGLPLNGDGLRASSGNYVNLQTTARALGFSRPHLGEALLHFRYSPVAYFAFGGSAGGSFAGQRDASATDATASSVVGNAALSSFTFGPEVWGMLPLGPVTLRLGALLFARNYQLTAADLAVGGCSYTDAAGQTHDSCANVLNSWSLAVQTRVQVDVQLGAGVALGAYGGFEFYPLFGFSAGATLSVQTPGFGDRWAWHAPPPAGPAEPEPVPPSPPRVPDAEVPTLLPPATPAGNAPPTAQGLPLEPTREELSRVTEAASTAVRGCLPRAPGSIELRLVFEASGRLQSVLPPPGLAHSAVGQCIAAAFRQATVSPFGQPSFTATVSISLRP